MTLRAPLARSRITLCALALLACDRAPREPAESTPNASAAPSAPAPSAEPKASAPAPLPPLSVLLITVDSLRADMPWTGYPRDVAPNLSRLAAEGVVYSHAYALSSYTSMSLAGLMAGRHPSELPRDGRATSSFLPEADFLAEHAAAAGLHTIGVHGHVYFLGATGISQGFARWRLFPKIVLHPAREGAVVDPTLTDLLLEELREHHQKPAAPRSFSWVHYMDPHFSYVRHPGVEPYRGSPYAEGQDPVPPGAPLSAVGQSLRNQYDGEVRHTDQQIGRLLTELSKEPWADELAIVVTADHGEAFGEHKSYFEHGFLLYEVTTRVPLLFKIPGVAPRRIDARRSHLDLARTLLELLNVEAPSAMRGESLVPELRGLVTPTDRDIVIDMPYTDQSPRRRALIHGDLKLIVTETDQRPQLFDLEADPSERQDLGADTERAAPLLERLKQLEAARPDYPAPRLSRRQY
ncbi:MAG: sulfatase [Polyangiaceae bacterium]|nr:sulfatase [Polyangiaceae bacterium]MCW5791018.1 sulfatase [Polyangiaceae bacterium]